MIFLDREGFIKSLGEEEKSQNTISKYVRDTEAFLKYTEEVEISKEAVTLLYDDMIVMVDT